MPLARALLLTTLATIAACGVHTAPFLDADGRVVPGSIASMERLEVNGVDEAIWFRGRDVRNPPLVLLHGGPGASESALFRHYDSGLEEQFLVVYWEQRGTGRSYDADQPPPSMAIDAFVADLDVVVEQVRRRFHHDRVVLLGHSWGTAIGTLYAAAHPEKVAAYVGIGQIASMPEGELAGYEFALAEARRRGDRSGIDALEAIGPPPHDVDQMLVSRKWVERYGGSFHADLDTGDLIFAALGTDEANLYDLIQFGRGNRASLDAVWPELRQLDLRRHTRLSMPVFFFLGRFDWQVPAVVAASYFETIDAPCKRLVWFEGSAHNAPFEESAAFVGAMNEWVRPAAETGRCDGASCTAGGCALETHENRRSPAKGDAR